MTLDALAVVGGLAALVVGAELVVGRAARLAAALGVSLVVVGAVVVGFGTSLPELAVTVLAAADGSLGVALGNVVGSNVANVTLVVGAVALVGPLAADAATRRRELPLMLAAVALLAGLMLAGLRLGTVEGAVLLVGWAVATWLMLHGARARHEGVHAPVAVARELADRRGARRPWRDGLLALVGLVATVGGARLLVTGAEGLALSFGVSESLVGITVVAIGTSLPELATGVSAVRRGQGGLLIGNVLGSNVFNSLMVAGAAGVLGLAELDRALVVATVAMVATAALLAVLLRGGRPVGRPVGLVLVAVYAAVVVAAW